jgi:hypothetical protein
MANEGTRGRKALDTEIEQTKRTMATLRKAAEGTPPGHNSRVALKKAEEKLAELVKQLTRRDQTG